MSLESSPQYHEILGQPNEPVSLIMQTNSIISVSLIIESVGGSLGDNNYTIEVSNNGTNWLRLRDVGCGNGNSIDQNFNLVNNSVFASVLDFHYVRFSLPALGVGIRGCIYVSCR